MVKEVGGVSFNNIPQNGNSGNVQNNEKIVIDFSNQQDGVKVITVEKGMTVSELAIKYNTTVEDILSENNLSSQYKHDIYAGQTLRIPVNSAPEDVQLQRAHNKRIDAENKELEQKGITTPEDRAKHLIQKDLESGHLKFVEPTRFLGIDWGGNYYEYTPHERYIETYGELKNRYNLPDGTLKQVNYIPGGGNLDQAEIGHTVRIPKSYLESGIE